MGFFSFIRRLMGLERRRRLLTTGGIGEDAIDQVDEVVDLRGGPLKEHHRRLALRDKRLVPKRKLTRSIRIGKRKALFTRAEAHRLFSASLRTVNRGIRDLLPDEEQLARYGLPVWRSESDLAEALGIPLKELHYFSTHRVRDRSPHYVSFAIPKRGGGLRTIQAPKRRLKGLQRRLNALLLAKLPVSEHAQGFVPGRSIRTNAEPHVGKPVVIRMDLKDFFPTIHYGRVRGYFIAMGYGYPVAATLALLMTEAERQRVRIDDAVFHVPVGPRHCVQGAPTSPSISNAIVHRLDRRLAGVARRFGLAYTRYADDLTFSGEIANPGLIVRTASMIAREEGFVVNREKTRVMRAARRQTVTGAVVNRTLGLSRTERRRLRAAIHRHRLDAAQGNADPARRAHLNGKLAFLQMLNGEQAARLKAQMP
jgi:retron-type reverse transcriptase